MEPRIKHILLAGCRPNFGGFQLREILSSLEGAFGCHTGGVSVRVPSGWKLGKPLNIDRAQANPTTGNPASVPMVRGWETALGGSLPTHLSNFISCRSPCQPLKAKHIGPSLAPLPLLPPQGLCANCSLGLKCPPPPIFTCASPLSCIFQLKGYLFVKPILCRPSFRI